MKAEQIIAIDTKTSLKVLNYQGPVFINTEFGSYLLEVRIRYCKKCMKKTSHEWVRNRDFYYWRCPECLERHLKSTGLLTPKKFCNHVKKNLET